MGKVHAFETGRLKANGTFLRGEGFSSLLRRTRFIEFPSLAYAIEHPEGLIVIDTGMGAHVTAPRTIRGFPPLPVVAGEDLEIGPQMRERGLDPAEVRWVVLTHLDWDHTGGLHHFPGAEVLVHRPELEFARTRMGRARYRPAFWPDWFTPTAYDLDQSPYESFPRSRALSQAGDVHLVPIPGHSPGQVGVAYESHDDTLLFAADHMLRADWFAEDLEAGRSIMLGAFGKRDARETTRRIQSVLSERPPVTILPAHDSEAVPRLADLSRRNGARSGPEPLR
jgi:glyoxylase-like metal-dependent hydrolase (beta-lactamase superfamily II)